MSRAARVLDENPADIPFSLLYLVESGSEARLATLTGLEAGHPAAPPVIPLAGAERAAWPVAVGGTRELVLVKDVERRFGAISSRTWPEQVESAVIVPINHSAQQDALDALLAGLDRKSTRLNSSHVSLSRMPSSA